MMLESHLRSLSSPALMLLKLLIGVIVIAGFLSYSSAFADTKRYNVPVDNSPQKGPKDAPVTIIEFLDFQ